jgi:serine/threonine-protein kinase
MLRKLEKYEVLEEIGHGGMATVYRAHDTVLDRPVALKVMHPHLRAAEEARRRFHREARSVARLRHPRVLEIYDFSGEGSEEAYIAAELLTGPTLKQWREAQKDVPAEIAACFVIEIAKALEAAHAAGIVHRDVKPENVLLHEDRELRLTDFGIADMIDAQSMTATGQILGSPGHMAPEQIEGKDCDARTDLFSLGTVLYYLATGRLPFTGRNPHQVLKRIVDGEYADPLRVNPTIGGRMRALIVRSLARDPAERYQSAREMREELEAFIREAGIERSELMLERYLGDPEAVAVEVRAQTLERLIDLGARASDAGDVPTALDYYNRVLALDEGNERVLRLIERVGMDRRRRMLTLAGAALTAVGALTALGAWALWPPADDEERSTLVSIAAPHGDAGTGASSGIGDASARVAAIPDAMIADTRIQDARIPDALTADAPMAEGRAAVRDAGRSRAEPVRRGTREPRRNGPRPVRLMPSPLNVAIGIDGAAPVAWGSTFACFRGCELEPGPHSFRVVPGADIRSTYDHRTFQVTIPPGEDVYPIPLALVLADARLLVHSVPRATIELRQGEQVRFRDGRDGEVLLVPMRAAVETFRMYVSAPGYVTRNRFIHLQAGAATLELELPLTPEESPVSPPSQVSRVPR